MFTFSILHRLVRLTPVVAAIFAIAAAGNSARAEITERHRELSNKVFNRLLQVAERPERWDVWPPTLEFIDTDEHNAYASYREVDGKRVPYIALYRGEIEHIAEFDPDALALTLGHELAHLLHYHAFEREELDQLVQGKRVRIMITAMKRENELEADMTGLELAIKANFSIKGIKKNLANTYARSWYCGLRGLGYDHPAWDERIAFLEKDENQRRLWRSMSAFNNGVFLLQTQQFAHAELCFASVTEEFPECYEGWANLGYARLMRYCDALEPEDLESFDIGQLVVGGFYERPASMQALVRGVDERLWFDAVGALREAIRLGEQLKNRDPMVLAKANMAVAYLVRPVGKDLGEAERLFTEVLALLDNEKYAATVNPVTRAVILVNASAGRDVEDRLKRALAEIEQLDTNAAAKSSVASLTLALRYQQAVALLKSPEATDQTKAFDMLENYLANVRSTNSWWSLAYDRYAKLAETTGRTAKAKETFATSKSKKWRATTQIPVSGDLVIGLGDQTAAVVKSLGDADSVTSIVKGTNLKLYKYTKRGITLLAGSNIVAMFLDADAAPVLTLKRPEISGGTSTIKVGMSRTDFEKLLGDEWDADTGFLHDPEVTYQIYRDAGIAVRFKAGVVSEIAVIVNSQS